MKMKFIFILFLYSSFLLTPIIIRLIESTNDSTTLVSVDDEVTDSEKEIKIFTVIHSLKIDFPFTEFNSAPIISRDLIKHYPISFSILIPPPKMV
jgi:hypothetical protein